jgi:DNA-directed RNA polymerase subunit RPC12/RpoP
MQLSPLTRSNITGLFRQWASEAAEEPTTQRRRRVEERVVYVCLECHYQHDDKDDAYDCCKPDTPASIQAAKAITCPVCNTGEFASPRYAADCCLWRDLPKPDREIIADAVEAGATWKVAIEAQTGVAIAAPDLP